MRWRSKIVMLMRMTKRKKVYNDVLGIVVVVVSLFD